ncbi:MAG: SAM-dependent methyltransferase [Actinomycetota bacterium]|nr:SAM-dependent methyltransferase [Actinomycetota bacterium]
MTVGPAMAAVRERIRRLGPIPFDQYLELALYSPDGGFYSSVGEAGRGGDFLTSPELGTLFGAVLARAIDSWWEELGAPDPFVIVESAAGVGTLAKAVLASQPACAPALRYLLVERSPRLRERQPSVLAVEPASTVLGPMGRADDEDDDGAPVLPGGGPRVASLGELPVGPFTGVVIANELLDNLPFTLLERTASGWCEVRVGESEGDPDVLVEVLTPAEAADVEVAERLVPEAPVGGRIPLQSAAVEWLRTALRTMHRGRVVLVDYASSTPELATRPVDEWFRTYRGGQRGGAPLDRPGSQDLTAEVCIDQLARVQTPALDRLQSDFLAAHGIGDLVAEARAAWEASAARPDLAALGARSRVDEAAALLDPTGLGAFRVLEWTVG